MNEVFKTWLMLFSRLVGAKIDLDALVFFFFSPESVSKVDDIKTKKEVIFFFPSSPFPY